jgi:hypothetical protein
VSALGVVADHDDHRTGSGARSPPRGTSA